MKRTIYTLNGYNNFGNRLQLFALSRVVKKMVGDVDVYWPKTFMDKVKEFIKYHTPLQLRSIKEKRLQLFTTKYIPHSTGKGGSGLAIVGSDQVWNPSYFKNHQYLLETKCPRSISYAASMGVCSLTEEQTKEFRNALEKYSSISVREQSAMDLLQPLVPEKRIEVVLDPTLLLSRKEYEELEKKPKRLEENARYVLCYILGDCRYGNAIDDFAKHENLKVIYFSDKRDSVYGVEEFLYLIHHAQLICTDSFHASVFSLIYEKPFLVFKRTGKENYMYTRLQNLITTFHLRNREFNGKMITDSNLKIDYSEARKILQAEQKKSLNFLKKALMVKNEKESA